MPSIHYLNPPPHPFFDFVANIQDHPFFAASGPQNYPFRQNGDANQQSPPQQEQQPAEKSEKAKEKQPSVEDDNQDPPEVDPATLNAEQTPDEFRGMPFHGRGRFDRAFEDGPRRGGACGRGRGRDHAGPPTFGPHHGPHRYGHPHGPPRGPWWARGPPSPDHGPHHGPPHHHHGPGSRSPGRRGMRDGPGGFNLAEFLSNLGNRLGVDLSGAAEGLGLERFNAPRSSDDVDFEPRADVFDTAAQYVIHLSLPGAKKEDLGVDWDGENSILRIAGVVHRPGADEELLKHLAVNGRKREVGVFEKSIRLGTKRDPATIDVAGISAKMTDGVLVVKVPKVEVEHQKREVPITSSSSPSPAQAPERDVDMEKGVLLDAENTNDETPVLRATPLSAGAKEKEAEYQREVEARDTRSETMDYEHEEKLPEYEVEEPEHVASDDEEGEYVKINVD
jgi:HSP20 family molecular chaperone IbpA